MYNPETAMFRPLDESYIAITSKGLFMVVSTVVSDNQYGQEITSGFVVTFQIYEGAPLVYSFMSWEWNNRPIFKLAP